MPIIDIITSKAIFQRECPLSSVYSSHPPQPIFSLPSLVHGDNADCYHCQPADQGDLAQKICSSPFVNSSISPDDFLRIARHTVFFYSLSIARHIRELACCAPFREATMNLQQQGIVLPSHLQSWCESLPHLRHLPHPHYLPTLPSNPSPLKISLPPTQ